MSNVNMENIPAEVIPLVTTSIGAKYYAAIEAATGLCTDAGMHPGEMLPILRHFVKQCEEAAHT